MAHTSLCDGVCNSVLCCPGYPYACEDGCYQMDCTTAAVTETISIWMIILLAVGGFFLVAFVVKCLVNCIASPCIADDPPAEAPSITLVERQ